MMYLKYPEPELQTAVHPGGVVFFLPPQGKPGVTDDNTAASSAAALHTLIVVWAGCVVLYASPSGLA
ncbi:Uncharacterised protein [Escherichia coli]|uniref:Uncharacterized protein n=1 Tax=Escherichia coli TaxID=562 RepID=A0A376KK07_ECOLX|nr:Uncharacterised protein [Escherichia coli]